MVDDSDAPMVRTSQFTSPLLPKNPPSIPRSSGRMSSTFPKRQKILAYTLITIIASSYMYPWVSVGTQIDYYNYRFGPDFFVYLNTAFYLPGLPVSSLQLLWDEQYDLRYGISRLFPFRMMFSLVSMAVTMFAFPNANRDFLLLLTALLGIFTWTAHGTLTPMAGLFPRRAVGFLQFGFQLPNAFALLGVMVLGMYGACDTDIPKVYTLDKRVVFYGISGTLALIGVVCTARLSCMRITREAQGQYQKDLADDSARSSGSLGSEEDQEEEDEDDDVESGRKPLLRGMGNGGFGSPSKLRRSATIVDQNPVLATVRLHRYVLFATIFSSIFSGSFFSKVPSVNGPGAGLGQILYFTRLFSDLLGRIFTFLPRKFLTVTHLTIICILRLLLLVIFFLYVLGLTPKNDVFITALVGVCAFQSGYNAVLVYELAGAKVADEFEGSNTASSVATKALNMSFQYACFAACLCNVLGV
eukprot:CAMPEP_0197563174 /NCGR_PEP_ID=MMETSP1320-20131121/28249_1 /TAXON_ID=91990 /ORGANISM="Bolidomonas sp., Strain RCC2347" /LENGTH=470 /DNA_ID=CAMNT_0043124963 /DNA_START=188 /DNA_END=1597 /DNA_ORIENTATION=+